MRQAFHTLAQAPRVPKWGPPPPPPPRSPEEGGGGGGGGDRPMLIGCWSTASLQVHPIQDALNRMRDAGAPSSLFSDLLGAWAFMLLPSDTDLPPGAGRIVAMSMTKRLPGGERFGLLLPFDGPKDAWRPGGKAREMWDRLLRESGWHLIEAGA